MISAKPENPSAATMQKRKHAGGHPPGRALARVLASLLFMAFCLGSATTERMEKRQPVRWDIYLEGGEDPDLQPCKDAPKVRLHRGSPPRDAQQQTRFRLEASRPQPLEHFEAQLVQTAQAWCRPRVSLLRAEMLDGAFLAEKVWAVTWFPAWPPKQNRSQ